MRSVTREIIETVILALMLFLALQFSLQNFRVEGISMQPTLEGGQYVLVNKLLYVHFPGSSVLSKLPFLKQSSSGDVYPFHAPRTGDVIVFKAPPDPSRDFVKRVIGVPGDTVSMVNGNVFVNGKELNEPYVYNKDNYNMAQITVPPNSYFVLGDNRKASDDSRDWGFVPAGNIIGRAWVAYWPPSQWEVVQGYHNPGH